MQALPYLPSFYFGSLMMLIGWEIIWDWLLTSYKKVTPKEFALLWATFLAICVGAPFPISPTSRLFYECPIVLFMPFPAPGPALGRLPESTRVQLRLRQLLRAWCPSVHVQGRL